MKSWWNRLDGRARFLLAVGVLFGYIALTSPAVTGKSTSRPSATVAKTSTSVPVSTAPSAPTATAASPTQSAPPPTLPRTPTPTVWDPAIGQEARLHVDGGPGQQIGLAVSEAGLEQFQKALAANDDIGVRDLLILGLVFAVDNDTRVLVIEYNGGFFTPRERYRVRVLEGKQQTRAGWVLAELLIRP